MNYPSFPDGERDSNGFNGVSTEWDFSNIEDNGNSVYKSCKRYPGHHSRYLGSNDNKTISDSDRSKYNDSRKLKEFNYY